MYGLPSYFLFFIKTTNPAKLIPMTCKCLESIKRLRGRSPIAEVGHKTARKPFHS